MPDAPGTGPPPPRQGMGAHSVSARWHGPVAAILVEPEGEPFRQIRADDELSLLQFLPY